MATNKFISVTEALEVLKPYLAKDTNLSLVLVELEANACGEIEVDDRLLNAIQWPLIYDNNGQFIFDSKGKMICEVRGWGWIQKLDTHTIAGKMQDGFGKAIVKLITLMKPKYA